MISPPSQSSLSLPIPHPILACPSKYKVICRTLSFFCGIVPLTISQTLVFPVQTDCFCFTFQGLLFKEMYVFCTFILFLG